jgi:glycosyltransferase involved in cell wall biosynthesis
LLTEIRYFKSMTKNRQLAGTFISTNNFQNILFYYLIGKIFKTTTVVDTVEYWTANKNIKGLERIDKYLYDKFYFLFTDRVICISDFLIKKVWTSKKPYILKVPSITDFDKFSNNNGAKLIDERYFLYCGSDAYFEVIDFVIVSFDRLNKDGVLLVLVTNDSEKIRQRISLSKRNKFIRLLTNQPYSDLVNLYKNSEGLIIPMRNSDQDKARFPHKISEYCASKRPIITNNVGEIKNYFNHNNAYLCNDMNEQEFADKMEEIISDPSKADIIGSNSFQTGIVNFNYKSYSKPITELFNKQ